MNDAITKRFEELEEKVAEVDRFLHTKVDCEIFDEEMHNIKNMLAALNSDDKQAIT